MCKLPLSKEDIGVRSRRLSALYVSRCSEFIVHTLGLSLKDFCDAGNFRLDAFCRIAAGQFTPSLEYLMHIQYLMEWFWSRSSVTTPFPELREML